MLLEPWPLPVNIVVLAAMSVVIALAGWRLASTCWPMAPAWARPLPAPCCWAPPPHCLVSPSPSPQRLSLVSLCLLKTSTLLVGLVVRERRGLANIGLEAALLLTLLSAGHGGPDAAMTGAAGTKRASPGRGRLGSIDAGSHP